MAITASGYYGLTLEAQLIDTAGFTLEDASNTWNQLVTDGYTHNYETHNFEDDITNEVTAGAGYSAGGIALAAAALTIGNPTVGDLRWDATDPAWAASTIADAMALVVYDSTGTDTTDALIMLADFGTAVSTSNGTLTVQIATNGLFFISYAA